MTNGLPMVDGSTVTGGRPPIHSNSAKSAGQRI
jgi:hypothetical protein